MHSIDYVLSRSKYIILLITSLCLILIFSCKKDKNIDAEREEIVSPTTGTRPEFTLDSIFLYAKQIYLWNEVLPEYKDFKPREKYLSISKPEIVGFKKELFDITQLKVNPATGKPYELSFSGSAKYSYLQSGRANAGTSQAGSLFGDVIMSHTIIESGDKKIAYVALNGFPSLISIKSKLDNIFEEISVEKPKYFILDLRYNRGGYVETAEYLVNLMVPNTLNGKVMYSEQFNPTLQQGKASILKYQPYLDENGKAVIFNGRKATMADVDYTEKSNTYRFDKKGKLETIEDIYVITSNETASASELLISCLKPYFDVKLVGGRTYGKPIGFFGINIDQYAVYLSSFLIKNADGWYDYFNGIEADLPVAVAENAPLGDPNELCLKTAISAINSNVKSPTKKTAVIPKQSTVTSTFIAPKIETGAMENRLRLKFNP